MGSSFKAFTVFENQDGSFSSQIISKNIDDLPKGDILIRVAYSSLNYKDGLSASGNKGVTKKYPHTPGIDAVGTVEDSSHSDFNDGDTVIVKKANTANNGQIVVALIDDHEAMLKRIRKKGKVVALESANKNYETKIFGPDRVKVQGVLVSLYRNF